MMKTPRFAPLAALLSFTAFATGCAFDPKEDGANENTGTQEQAAIVYRGAGPGVAPGCGVDREKGGDGLCYARCPGGFTGVVTRCIETGDGVNVSCFDGSDGVGHCIVEAPCGTAPREAPGQWSGMCRHSRPRRSTDRGVGVAPSCALLQRTTGKDGLCYPLTSTSGDITPASPKPAAPAPTPAPAPSGGAVSAAANDCIHTLDASGHAKVWVNDGFGGRCLTQAEYYAMKPLAQGGAETGEDICPLLSGCDFKVPENMYKSPGNSTDFVTTTGYDRLGSPDPSAWPL